MLEPLLRENNVKLFGAVIVSLQEQTPSESMVTLFWLAVEIEKSDEGWVDAGVTIGNIVSFNVEPAATEVVGWNDIVEELKGTGKADRGTEFNEGSSTKLYALIVEYDT